MEPLLIKTSRASRFRRHSRSLKTTIPIEVVELLKIEPEDTLTWEVSIVDNERLAVVKRAPHLKGAK